MSMQGLWHVSTPGNGTKRIVEADAPWQPRSMHLAESMSAKCSWLILPRHGEVFVLDDGGEVDLDLGN